MTQHPAMQFLIRLDTSQGARFNIEHYMDWPKGSAKLFNMVAKGQFPKPFTLIPGGRAVGWVEADVDDWITSRKQACEGALL
jgi:hypothetical protein